MADLAAVPFARSSATDWSALSRSTLRVSERTLRGALLLKAGRHADLAPIQPPPPNTWTSSSDTRWLWQGPREWLLLSEAEPAAALEDRMARLLSHITAAVLDVTDRVLLIDIRGAAASRVFSQGTSLDPALLPAGSVSAPDGITSRGLTTMSS